MKLLVVEYGQFEHAQREKKTQACLTKGSYAGYHTRWRGLELSYSTLHRLQRNVFSVFICIQLTWSIYMHSINLEHCPYFYVHVLIT